MPPTTTTPHRILPVLGGVLLSTTLVGCGQEELTEAELETAEPFCYWATVTAESEVHAEREVAYRNMWLQPAWVPDEDVPPSLEEEVFADVSYDGSDYEQMQEVSANAVDWCDDHDLTVVLD